MHGLQSICKQRCCSEASVHTSLITRTPKCEETDYNVLYCYVLCTMLLIVLIYYSHVKSVATQFLWSHVVMLFSVNICCTAGGTSGCIC